MMDDDRVAQDFYDVRNSFWCASLTNCELKSYKGNFGTGQYFADWLDFDVNVPLVGERAKRASFEEDEHTSHY